MADESKLKAQAREFFDRNEHRDFFQDEMMAAFARQVADEQVKAETADLREHIEVVLSTFEDTDCYQLKTPTEGCETCLAIGHLRQVLTKLQEVQ